MIIEVTACLLAFLVLSFCFFPPELAVVVVVIVVDDPLTAALITLLSFDFVQQLRVALIQLHILLVIVPKSPYVPRSPLPVILCLPPSPMSIARVRAEQAQMVTHDTTGNV